MLFEYKVLADWVVVDKEVDFEQCKNYDHNICKNRCQCMHYVAVENNQSASKSSILPRNACIVVSYKMKNGTKS